MRIRVEKMAPEGQGLGREPGGGRVLFIPYAAPGDLLRVSVEKVKKGYGEARLLEVLEPGPRRVEPKCPLHFKAPGS
ncbi:MAG: TRAM domain-containing protein, partial [Elusimicrobiota bacterium]